MLFEVSLFINVSIEYINNHDKKFLVKTYTFANESICLLNRLSDNFVKPESI